MFLTLCVFVLMVKRGKKNHQIQAFLSVQFSSVKDIYIVKQISGPLHLAELKVYTP